MACFIRGQLWPSTRDGPGDRGVEMVFVLWLFADSPGESVPAASPNRFCYLISHFQKRPGIVHTPLCPHHITMCFHVLAGDSPM